VLSVLFAERAILAHNESIGIVLLVLHRIVVSALTFSTFKSDFSSCRLGCHNQNSIQKNYTLPGAYREFTIFSGACQSFFREKQHIFLFFSFFL
jgi:hypothetical protein